ncbi:retrovirus-related pol polyprotein from transposon TNT 1-94 [Tanacetum coccineum]
MNKGKSKKGLVVESFDWDEESVSSDDEGVTTFKALMAIADEELSVGRADARSGQWGDLRKNLLSKYNSLKQEFSLYKIFDLKKVIEKWTSSRVTLDQLLIDQVLRNIVRALGGKGMRKDKFSSKEVMFTKYDVSSSETSPEMPFDSDSEGDTKGYGSVNCNGITFTKVAYVNGLKHNLISISQLCDANLKVMLQRLREPYSIKTMKLFSLPQEKEMSIKMENLDEIKVKELRSDNGTEFKKHKLEEFYDEKGISQNFSSPCTLEQNGVAERRNRTLIEAARTMLNTYDVFRGRSSDISYFYVFGCHVHIHNHKDHLGKFNEKADDGFFLGYSLVAKAFGVFNIRRQEMEETYHVTFSEDDEAISQTSTEGNAINFNKNRSFPDDEF